MAPRRPKVGGRASRPARRELAPFRRIRMSDTGTEAPTPADLPSLTVPAWESLGKSSQARALKRRAVLGTYWAAIWDGKTISDACLAARGKWLMLFQRNCSTRSIYRLRDAIERAGGIQYADPRAFIDRRILSSAIGRNIARPSMGGIS